MCKRYAKSEDIEYQKMEGAGQRPKHVETKREGLARSAVKRRTKQSADNPSGHVLQNAVCVQGTSIPAVACTATESDA